MGFNFGDCWFGLNHNDHNNHHDLPEEVGEMIQNKKNSDFIKAVNKNTLRDIIVCLLLFKGTE